jgi:hypothetical protein
MKSDSEHGDKRLKRKSRINQCRLSKQLAFKHMVDGSSSDRNCIDGDSSIDHDGKSTSRIKQTPSAKKLALKHMADDSNIGSDSDDSSSGDNGGNELREEQSQLLNKSSYILFVQ